MVLICHNISVGGEILLSLLGYQQNTAAQPDKFSNKDFHHNEGTRKSLKTTEMSRLQLVVIVFLHLL